MNRFTSSLFAALVAVLWAAPAAHAASCNGASHEPSLTNGTASPGSASTSTPVTFSVLYADTGDCAPTAAAVNIAGVGTLPLIASGTTYASGVTYRTTLTLPAGDHAYSFSFTSGQGGGGEKTATLTAVAPATVLVQAPAPAPAPIPSMAPTPVTPPPPTPTPTRRVVVPLPPPPTPQPTVQPTATPTAEVSPTPALAPADAAPTQSVSDVPGAAGYAAVHDSWSPAPAMIVPSRIAAYAPTDGPSSGLLGVIVGYLMATVAGLTFFFVLSRRQLAPALRPVRASGRTEVTLPGAASPGRLPPMPQVIAPMATNLLEDSDDAREPLPEEASVPRWLRPSVQAARGAPTELRHRDWR